MREFILASAGENRRADQTTAVSYKVIKKRVFFYRFSHLVDRTQSNIQCT